MTIVDGVIADNSAAGGFSDGDAYGPSSARYGGGVYATGSVAITGSSVTGNETTDGGGRGAGVKAGDVTVSGSS
ncbi:MAG: hypothetical protein AAF322_13665, partial [Pseudomonadota bacterium]